MQDCGICSALALEIPQSCTKWSICIILQLYSGICLHVTSKKFSLRIDELDLHIAGCRLFASSVFGACRHRFHIMFIWYLAILLWIFYFIIPTLDLFLVTFHDNKLYAYLMSGQKNVYILVIVSDLPPWKPLKNIYVLWILPLLQWYENNIRLLWALCVYCMKIHVNKQFIG